ncbi:thiamine pyrophosphate-requiring protein [Planosporangium sp. 12N6]|uniref:thiamine pyrophosphate-requiring protein n=1 Tax=Planosporangium spinosum TaxID=3402278 RepID=UPI003CF41E8F
MGTLVADAVVARLRAWGVRTVFGYSGDGLEGLLGALTRAGTPEFVQARHEESAAFMATAHAKYTGELSACASTRGPGAVHLLGGLYDARHDHTPVLAVLGEQAGSVAAYQHGPDPRLLYQDVAGGFCAELRSAADARTLVDRAARHAVATRGPAVLVIPHDMQYRQLPAGAPDGRPAGYGPARIVPDEVDLRAAAQVLNAGQRVAILVGQGALGAAAEIVGVADRLAAGVGYALLGKPALDNRLPFVTGPTGHLGTTASYELMRDCDTLLMVGTDEPWSEYLPAVGQARAVQVDIDGRRLGYRYPTQVNLLGDAALTLRALLPLLRERTDRSWRTRIEESVLEWRRLVARLGAEPARWLNPHLVFAELNARLPERVLIGVDVGSSVYWYARQLYLRPGMVAHLSGTFAAMGCGVPYGLAAKLAHPDRPVLVVAGDGAMQMLGMAELISVARYRDRFTDPRFVILVLHNNDLGEVSWEQRELDGDPRFAASQALPDVDYAGHARLLGLDAVRVERPDEVDPALDRAFTAGAPVLVDAVIEPAVPLVPPHLAPAQARRIDDSLRAEGEFGSQARRLLAAHSEIEFDRTP